MGDLHGIEEDVPFDWHGAEALAAKFKATATQLDAQVPRRNAYADDALEQWRGSYARDFTQRMGICTDDAGQLAESMREAAQQLDELARLAREEQQRRVKAREWKSRQHGGLLGAVEGVGHALGIGHEEEPPPVDHGDGRRFTAPAHLPGVRA